MDINKSCKEEKKLTGEEVRQLNDESIKYSEKDSIKTSEDEGVKHSELRKTAANNEEAIRRLVDLVELLRKECPWDKEQTHDSLRTCMLEEAYETVEAINNKDMKNLKEELGDVLLQVVFHTSLAREDNQFALWEVINDECDKMIRRHPHIFSEERINTVDKVLEKWENVKRIEKGTKTQTQRLKDVPRALPALMRSYKVQARAAEVGFDWDDVSEAIKKVREETQEFIEAMESKNQAKMTDEMGDLFFSVVNVARFCKINPEEALNGTADKFIRRFSQIEQKALKMGKSLDEMTLEEMDELWENVKILENSTETLDK